MFTSINRSFYVLSNKFRRRQPVERMKEKWIADFSKPEKSCFTIKPEISHDAYLEKSSLFLGLKRKNCMTWLETVNRVYVDQVINAHFRFDGLGGYCAAGIMFRIAGQGTYYLALVSSKGYFRLDAVNNNIPRPLIGWTEAPGLNDGEANLGMIVKGDHLIFFLNGRWIAEANDHSIPGGHLGFALVSYDSDIEEGYVCQSWLDSLSVDSRPGIVEAEYKKWRDNAEISAESRFSLAHSLAALGYSNAAHDQILKVWKQREETAKSVMATYTEMRTRGELLFAAQMALQLERYAVAEEYLNACFAMGVNGDEELNVLVEKAKVLSAQNKYEDLVAFLPGYIQKYTDIPSLHALLGHAYWNLKNYEIAATSWNNAWNLDTNNSLYEELKKKAEEKTKKKAAAATAAAKKTAAKLKPEPEATIQAPAPAAVAPKAEKLKPQVKTVTASKTAAKLKPEGKARVKTAATKKTATAKKTTVTAKPKVKPQVKTAAVKKTMAKKTATAKKPKPRGRPRKTAK